MWTLSRKTWTEVSAKLSLEKNPSKDVVALTQGSNVLVLVSDTFTGHLQFISPNKKEELTDAALGDRLQTEFQIDVTAYEFATQRANLSRSQVQVSVSGVETAVYQQVLEWTKKLQPRKFWVMPFAWFLAPLKSVEPVLLGVIGPKDQVLVSHHYLGVDDARELEFSEVIEYVQSRKEERKETHLFYVQGPAKSLKKLEAGLEDVVAVHPLVGESSEDALAEVITEVMSKGGDTLAELLHFEEEGVIDEGTAEGSVSQTEEDSDSDQNILEGDAADLPQPSLPQPVAPASKMRVEVTSVTVESDSAELESSSAREEVVLEDSNASTDSSDLHAEMVDDREDEAGVIEESTAEREEEIVEVDPISRLAAEKSATSQPAMADSESNPRYRDVAPRRSWGAIVMVFLGVVIVTVLVGGAIFWSQQVRPTQQALIPSDTPPTPTPTPAPTATPEPTALSVAEKEQLTMVVRNATTRAGLAGRYQTALEEAGWNVSGTGNASGDYTSAAVFIYTTNDAAFETLSQEFGGVTVTRMTENLENTPATVDVVVVLNQPVEPTVTAVE